MTVPPDMALLQDQPAFDIGNAVDVPSSEAPDGSAVAAAQRSVEEQQFQQILRDRSGLPALSPINAPLPAARLAEIEGPAPDSGRVKIGVAVDIDRDVDFSVAVLSGAAGAAASIGGGEAQVLADGSVAWEAMIITPGATEIRLNLQRMALSPGTRLWVYNEIGQVFGPYEAAGPDDNGELWTPSLLGDRMRLHIHAVDASALTASRFTMVSVMHTGSRASQISEATAQTYLVGPQDDRDINFCGRQVPDCTIDGMCAVSTNAGLTNATNAIAHIRYVEAGSTYICSGSFISQTGNLPQQPYFLTANHCFGTQASASTVEAYFKYRTNACNGTCPTLTALPRVNGSTLLATGAYPTYADFTLVRLSAFPATTGIRLLGWTTAQPAEASYLIHMGHPAGSPLAYSYRRVRHNNAQLPHGSGWAEPTFIYSGLAAASQDWSGATAGGSSGGPALQFTAGNADTRIIGQLTGAVHTGTNNQCNPAQSTVDGALRSSFPHVRRFIYDKIYWGGFQ